MSQTIGQGLLAAALAFAFSAGPTTAGERLEVRLDSTARLDLDRPAAVVAVANPAIADVSVQSPRIVVVTGKGLGVTSLDLLDADRRVIGSWDVVVTPDTKDQVTVDYGADGLKTLACQPRCIRVTNPGKDPEPSGGGGAGGGKKPAGGGAKLPVAAPAPAAALPSAGGGIKVDKPKKQNLRTTASQ